MPQITAYATKFDLERWMKLPNKAAAIRWLLDAYENGDVELPDKPKAADKQIPKVPDEKMLREMPVIKTPEDAKRAVEPIAPHQNFFKKPKKGKK